LQTFPVKVENGQVLLELPEQSAVEHALFADESEVEPAAAMTAAE
jgi:hypothetical protein